MISSTFNPATHLPPLLAHLAHAEQPEVQRWQGWEIRRITGGANNLIYRAQREEVDLAVKWTMRDQRQRAAREFYGLQALREAGLAIAPQALWLDETHYPQPVVVQSWEAGRVDGALPATDEEWERVVVHYVKMQQVRPDNTTYSLPMAVLHANDAEAAIELVCQQLALLPEDHIPPRLPILVQQLTQQRPTHWHPVQLALSRADSNLLNFIRRPKEWLSVDWEYSGWCDPAFAIAEITTHPTYLGTPPSRWEWLIERYHQLTQQPELIPRIHFYRQALLLWWVARLARVLYEVPRGKDQRLVRRPVGWEMKTRTQLETYLALASGT